MAVNEKGKKVTQRFEISVIWEDGQVAMQAPGDPLMFMMVMGDAIAGYAVQHAQKVVDKGKNGGNTETVQAGPSMIVGSNAPIAITKGFMDKINQAKKEGRV